MNYYEKFDFYYTLCLMNLHFIIKLFPIDRNNVKRIRKGAPQQLGKNAVNPISVKGTPKAKSEANTPSRVRVEFELNKD